MDKLGGQGCRKKQAVISRNMEKTLSSSLKVGKSECQILKLPTQYQVLRACGEEIQCGLFYKEGQDCRTVVVFVIMASA